MTGEDPRETSARIDSAAARVADAELFRPAELHGVGLHLVAPRTTVLHLAP